jgi:hypothetical protein
LVIVVFGLVFAINKKHRRDRMRANFQERNAVTSFQNPLYLPPPDLTTDFQNGDTPLMDEKVFDGTRGVTIDDSRL